HALALEEALARLQRVAELAHGSVEGGRARRHTEYGEDAAVRLGEGDVERGGHVLHVELGRDLAAEVEQDQVPLDLLGCRALEARRLLLRRRGHADADADALAPGLDREHLDRHAGEGVAKSLARGI